MREIYIFIAIGDVIGSILIVFGFIGINKLAKEHKKRSNNELLLEDEKPIQNRNITLLIVGFGFIFFLSAINIIISIIGLLL